MKIQSMVRGALDKLKRENIADEETIKSLQLPEKAQTVKTQEEVEAEIRSKFRQSQAIGLGEKTEHLRLCHQIANTMNVKITVPEMESAYDGKDSSVIALAIVTCVRDIREQQAKETLKRK